MLKRSVLVFGTAAIKMSLVTVSAGAADTHAAITMGEQCQALASTDFSGIPDAPTQVTEARVVEAAGDVPAYCRVEGYVIPQVGIEVWLPASNWNGKFLKIGCGAFCGSTGPSLDWLCKGPLRKGYACIASDMGHRSSGFDGKWAFNNPQAEIDYGYRAAHVATLAGKTITEKYYSRAPARSYFLGCSTGGRQGLVEAQRFPWDFDGIVAGAPAMNLASIQMDYLWGTLAVSGGDGKPMFSVADLQGVHRAVLAECDEADGLKDGLLEDPRRCEFDPSRLVCRPGAKTECLSQVQVEALTKLYSGPPLRRGRIRTGGVMPGSELALDRSFILSFSQDFFRYMAFLPDPGPKWQAQELDFDRDYERFGMMEALYGASNPDLRHFKAAGGKLILYHGWNDALISPLNTLDYYATAMNTLGGRAATQDFLRLFMIPGMNHCGEGEGAWAIDYLSYLEAWVEQGRAPEMMVSAHVKDTGLTDLRFPLDPAKVTFMRPVYPYPLWAKYKGAGDPNGIENFSPVEP